MQQKIERLQAQLGDLNGKCKDTSCASNTQNQLSQKLENANVELEFQVFNYARENAHLKTTYKNLFDSISVSRVQTETKIASLQNELQCNIYKNAKLRTQLYKKVSDQKDNTQDSSKNIKFAKQPNVEILPKIVWAVDARWRLVDCSVGCGSGAFRGVIGATVLVVVVNSNASKVMMGEGEVSMKAGEIYMEWLVGQVYGESEELEAIRMVGEDELLSKVLVAPESSLNKDSFKSSMLRTVSKVRREFIITDNGPSILVIMKEDPHLDDIIKLTPFRISRCGFLFHMGFKVETIKANKREGTLRVIVVFFKVQFNGDLVRVRGGVGRDGDGNGVER
nr:hypothetical protein [Tanacetum cinerariifolium]